MACDVAVVQNQVYGWIACRAALLLFTKAWQIHRTGTRRNSEASTTYQRYDVACVRHFGKSLPYRVRIRDAWLVGNPGMQRPLGGHSGGFVIISSHTVAGQTDLAKRHIPRPSWLSAMQDSYYRLISM